MQIVLVLIGLAILISASIAGISAAPWLPTKPSQRKHLLDNLKLDDGMTVIDLGCGDGSMLFALAKKNSTLKCIGYDISLLPLVIAWCRKLWGLRRYRKVSIKFGNLFTQKIDKADVVFVFLLDKSYPRLIEKFKREISPSARVVVEAWPLPGIDPTETIKAEGLLPVFIYSGSVFRAS